MPDRSGYPAAGSAVQNDESNTGCFPGAGKSLKVLSKISPILFGKTSPLLPNHERPRAVHRHHLTSGIDAMIIVRWRMGICVLAMENDRWTPLLRDADAGIEGAKERLFAALYTELHELAERQVRRNAGAAISPTTLLHETYLNMAQRHAVFPDRARFMGYASRVMRGLIIDLARQRQTQKRGARFHITRLDTEIAAQQAEPDSEERGLLRLSEALDMLAVRDPRLAELVDLKYFCGFSLVEIAALRGVSERTTQRDWEKARLVLYREIGEQAAT